MWWICAEVQLEGVDSTGIIITQGLPQPADLEVAGDGLHTVPERVDDELLRVLRVS